MEHIRILLSGFTYVIKSPGPMEHIRILLLGVSFRVYISYKSPGPMEHIRILLLGVCCHQGAPDHPPGHWNERAAAIANWRLRAGGKTEALELDILGVIRIPGPITRSKGQKSSLVITPSWSQNGPVIGQPSLVEQHAEQLAKEVITQLYK